MPSVVLRNRMVSGDRVDVTYEESDAADDSMVIEHLFATLAHDGALHCTPGDRLMVMIARGVAAVGVAPRGATSNRSQLVPCAVRWPSHV